MTQSLDLSHGEFAALVAKAFRGVGYSWGLTEDAAFAAGRLAEAGLASAASVVRLLRAVDGTPVAERMPNPDWSANSAPLCPICVGTAIVDGGAIGRGRDANEQFTIGRTVEPLLIAPFLSTMAAVDKPGSGFVLEWGAASCLVSSAAITLLGTPPPDPTTVTIRTATDGPRTGPSLGRVRVTDADFGALERYAHRVYAPATDASRSAGAGAGATDND
ncbi:MAG: DUF3726 domain-containing protein [Actinomycetota bacterium]